MSKIDYEARVAKGIALLDAKMPGWPFKIDLDRLDIGNGDVCMTAQLSGVNQWAEGMMMLGLTQGPLNNGTYTLHGFNVETDMAVTDASYDPQDGINALNAIWRREILARIAPPEVSA